MNFADEPYVRVYKRRTTTMAVVGWQARAVLRELFLVVDKAGVLDLDEDDPVASIAALIDVPEDILIPAMTRLESKGCVIRNGYQLVIPRFREAQETPASDRLRAKESRGRRRADAMSAVTKRDTESQNVTAPSQDVTESHTASHDVTPCHSEQSRAEQSNTPPTPSEDIFVPCPKSLALEPDQRATLSMAVPEWAIDQLTARFVAKAMANKRDTKTLQHWSKCLVLAISGDWNDPGRRPRRDAQNSESDPTGGRGFVL